MIKVKKLILKTSVLVLGVGVLSPALSVNLVNNEVHAASIDYTEPKENIELNESILYQEEVVKPTYELKIPSVSIMNVRTYQQTLTDRQVRDLVYELTVMTAVTGVTAALLSAIPWYGYLIGSSLAVVAFQATVTAANLNRQNMGNGVVIITSASTGSTTIRPRAVLGGGGGPIRASIEDEF